MNKTAQLSQQEIKACLAGCSCYFLDLCDCCRVFTVVLVLMSFSSHAVCEPFLLGCTGNLLDFVGSIISCWTSLSAGFYQLWLIRSFSLQVFMHWIVSCKTGLHFSLQQKPLVLLLQQWCPTAPLSVCIWTAISRRSWPAVLGRLLYSVPWRILKTVPSLHWPYVKRIT